MALAIDASSPVMVKQTTSPWTTASFTPPAGSLLVACANADPGRTFTISDSSALTWTQIINAFPSGSGSVTAWWAVQASSVAMTVSASSGTPSNAGLNVYVITGANTVSPTGVVTSGGTTADTNNTLTKSITPSFANSFGFICADDFSTVGATTSSDTTWTSYDITGNISGGSGWRTMGVAGTAQSLTVDAAGTSSANWAWGVFEIKVAAVVSSRATPFMSQYSSYH